MFKLWSTILKDVRILLRDKVGILLMFIMPVILVIIVTSIQNSTFQLINKNKLSILICNKDKGLLSEQFILAIDKIGLFKVDQLSKNADEIMINDQMHRFDALLTIIIPTNFSNEVKAKAKNSSGKALKGFGLQSDSLIENKLSVSPLTLYYNPIIEESLKYSVQGALGSALQLVETRETLRNLYFSINEKPLPEKLENEMLNNQTKINTIPTSHNGNKIVPNATQHNVPAWTIFAMFFIVMSLGGNVVREKISGSFIRLKTLPTSYLVGLLSKQITYLMVTILQAFVIFSIGVWLFPFINLPALRLPNDIAGLILVTFICGWCAVSYAICLGTFAQTQEQANGFGAVSIVILAIVGGLMVPSFALQGAFKTVINFSPLHWCLEAYQGLFLEGGKLKDVIPNLIPLMVITLLLQFITILGLKRKNLI